MLKYFKIFDETWSSCSQSKWHTTLWELISSEYSRISTLLTNCVFCKELLTLFIHLFQERRNRY